MAQNIYLWGLPGSGKSYIGARLAAALSRPFVDLDRLIEQAEARSISDIFLEMGEAGFRVLESRHLRTNIPSLGAVIACGGGTPCFMDNAEYMNAHGSSIYLDTPTAIIASRLRQASVDRPLLTGVSLIDLEDKLGHLLERRRPFYQKANHILSWSDDPTAYWYALLALCSPKP